jgi:hypothetical protein
MLSRRRPKKSWDFFSVIFRFAEEECSPCFCFIVVVFFQQFAFQLFEQSSLQMYVAWVHGIQGYKASGKPFFPCGLWVTVLMFRFAGRVAALVHLPIESRLLGFGAHYL